MSGSTNLSNGGQNGKSLPTSPDDMNASLLRPPNDEAATMNNNMFGKFKGFTMRPLQDSPPASNHPSSPLGPNVAFVQPVSKSGENKSPTANRSLTKSPVRAAPSVPKVPKLSVVGRSQSQNVENKEKKPSVAKIGRARTVVGDTASQYNTANEPPALPPLNPGAHPRPLISSPILESSTSTAKEMMSPLHNGKNIVPVRPAPKLELAKQQTKAPVMVKETDANEVDFAMKPLPVIENKGGTLKRIKSLMTKEEKPTAAAAVIPPVTSASNSKQHARKVPKFIDRNRLKTIEISAPIPQLETQTEINNRKSVLARTHSMRKESPTTEEAATNPSQLLSFGSTRSVMRNKNGQLTSSRPKSPPPPRPPLPAPMDVPPPPVPKDYNTTTASIDDDSYQRPPAPKKVNFAELPNSRAAPLASEDSSPATSPDNIYSVIDEDRLTDSVGGGEMRSLTGETSMESLGLLGEIVNEMENRNLGSIYATTTTGVNKGRKKEPVDDAPLYANTEEQEENDVVKGENEEEPSEDKSFISTTSSGYLKPIGAVKPVVAAVGINTPKGSSFKAGAAKGTEGTDKAPYKSYHASINRPFATQYSVPKGKTAAATKAEEVKVKKPQTPIKPVLKPTASKGGSGAGDGETEKESLSNVARMQKKFETANKKK